MNESFFVNTIFNLLIVSIGSCCLNLLFSSSVKFLNKLYKIVLWLVLIGFYEPYFNFSNGSSLIGNSYQLKTSSLIKRYNLSNSNLNNLTYLTDNFIKFGILLTNIILFGIICNIICNVIQHCFGFILRFSKNSTDRLEITNSGFRW